MRFLIGILTGTVLTLFIATAVDAPTQTTLNKATDALSALWQTLIERTSDSLFTPPGAAAEADSPVPDLLARADTPAPAARASLPTGHLGAAEPAVALAPPEELPPPPPVRVRIAPDAPLREQPQPATEVPLTATNPPPVEENPFSAEPADSDGYATGVWTPFHSQRSAQGFAARLSRVLDHDFRVERQGAGAYQVVFDVTSPDERDALLIEIAEITGQ